jgi:5-methylcytosine-specific restriction protein A
MVYCAQPGCGTLVARGRCAVHAKRPDAAVRKWYHLERWERLRRRVLVEAAYQCAGCGAVTVELHADHIRPHRGDVGLFWDRANLQALCVPCHTRKTVRGE